MKQSSWLWGDVRQCGWLRDVMWCHVKWSDVMSCHVVWSDVMSRDLMESDAKGWDVTFVMFCGWLWGHVMWCDVVVWCSELGDVQWTTERPWQQNPWDVHSGARWNPCMHNEIRLRRAHVTVLRLRTTNYYSLLKCNYDIGVTATSMLGGRHTWTQQCALGNLPKLHHAVPATKSDAPASSNIAPAKKKSDSNIGQDFKKHELCETSSKLTAEDLGCS